MSLAKLVKNYADAHKVGVEIVGHSLGGGLAATAALEVCMPPPGVKAPPPSMCKATTFNAVGLHPNSVDGKDLTTAAKYVDAFVVDGEPVNSAQDDRPNTLKQVAAVGALPNPVSPFGAMIPAWAATEVVVHGALPPPVGRRIVLPAAWNGAPPAWPASIERHGMKSVGTALADKMSTLLKQHKASECPP